MSSVKDNYRDTKQAAFYSKFRQVYPSTVHDRILAFLSSTSSGKSDSGKNDTSTGELNHNVKNEFVDDKLNNNVPEYIENGLNGRKVDGEKPYQLALDVGCGPGQGTLPLCQHFRSVIGLDTSAAQIEEARLKIGQGCVKGQVSFRVGDAEDLSFLEDNSVDLITVATAIHWFDVEKFSKECHRVLRPGGVLAAYCYTFGKHRTPDGQSIDQLSEVFWHLINEYKDPQIDHVLDKYVRLFPILQQNFAEAKRDDSISEKVTYSVEGMQGFMRSMSMYRNYRLACPSLPDPAQSVRDVLMDVYNGNPPEDAVHYSFDIFTMMAKK